VSANFSAIGGGYFNTVQSFSSTIAGGSRNTIETNSHDSTIGGGFDSTIRTEAYQSTIGGGAYNFINIDASSSTISGGELNLIQTNADWSTIGGGQYNTIASDSTYATIPGGYHNNAAGFSSFAAGNRAKANHPGSFVWGDSTSADFASTTSNQFSVRASGGLVFAGDVSLSGDSRYHNLSMSGGNSVGYLYGSYPALADGVHLGYNWYGDNSGNGHVANAAGATSRITAGYGFIDLAVGAVNTAPSTVMLHVTTSGVCANGTVSNCSDRNVKQDLASVSPAQILERVLQLPVSEWSYKLDPATRHIGPMAQDFYGAFKVGMDDKHIATIDESGVALAAIQGLNQKVEARIRNSDIRTQELEDRSRKLEIENTELKQKNQSLEQRLEALERSVFQQKSN
jgi:hypothetical protein